MAPRQPVAFTPPTPSFSSFLDGEVIIIETSGRTRGFGGKSLCCAVKPTPRDGPRKGCNRGKRALESRVYIKQFPSNTLKSDLLFQYTVVAIRAERRGEPQLQRRSTVVLTTWLRQIDDHPRMGGGGEKMMVPSPPPPFPTDG